MRRLDRFQQSSWFPWGRFLPRQSEQTRELLCRRLVVGSFETSLWPIYRSVTKNDGNNFIFIQKMLQAINLHKEKPGVPPRTTLRTSCGCLSRQIAHKNTCKGESLLKLKVQVHLLLNRLPLKEDWLTDSTVWSTTSGPALCTAMFSRCPGGLNVVTHKGVNELHHTHPPWDDFNS